MDGKQAMRSAVTTLLVLGTFSILPISGQMVVCPWCDNNMQSRLLDCVYTEMCTRPELLVMPLPDIDNIKWSVSAYSDSLAGLPYDVKKVKVDKKFVGEMANVIKKNNYQDNQEIVNSICDLAGKCYSSVTGYDSSVVSGDVKALLNDFIRKDTDPRGENPNPEPNSRMPYSDNQNKPNIFQPSKQQIQPLLNNAPFFPNPVSSLISPFDDRRPIVIDSTPFNPLRLPPANPFDNPALINNGPFNRGGWSPGNSFGNPSILNNPFNLPVSPPINPFYNPFLVSNGAGPSKDWSSNENKGQKQAGSPLQNGNNSQGDENSPKTADLFSTASPSQDSKSTDSNSSDNSNRTTPSPNSDASRKKTDGKKKSDDEEPCDEKFKSVLYDKLINDDRFRTFFGKLPLSATKPVVPKIIKQAFQEYGIEKHYTEFSTFWRFESRTLNNDSKVEDWAELIAKILKIIFSRNNLLNEDCKVAGKTIAGDILDTLPGDPPASSTDNTNQNDGNDETSTESNSSDQKANPAPNSTDIANLSFPELHSKLAKLFNNNGSTEENGGKVPFSELLKTFEIQENLEKLHNAAESCISPSGFDFDKFLKTMKNVTDTIQKNHPDWSSDKCQKEMYSATVAVLSKVLQDKLKSSNDSGKNKSSSAQPDSAVNSSDPQSSNPGAQPKVPSDINFSLDDLDDSTSLSPGTDLISDSVPQPQLDFTNDGTVPVNIPPSGNQPDPGYWNTGLTQPSNLAPTPVNTNNGDLANINTQNVPLSQPNAQNVPQQDYPGAQPNVPSDINLSSDDSTPLSPGTDLISDSVPQPQLDFTNDGTVPANIPPVGNQPGPGDWNTGLPKPSNLAPTPVNTNNGDLVNGNTQDVPLWQPNAQNAPPQDYSANPPASMNTQPNSGNQPLPASPNAGFQQPPNLAPDSGVVNYPNGNFGNTNHQWNLRGNNGFNGNPSQGSPALPNGNSPNFPSQPSQNYDSGAPAAGQNSNSHFNSNFKFGGWTG